MKVPPRSVVNEVGAAHENGIQEWLGIVYENFGLCPKEIAP